MIYMERRQNKYNAKSNYYNGNLYHSKKEAAYAESLDLLLVAKEIKSWDRQVKISLDVNGKDGKKYHICNYYCDFLVENSDGSKELHEVKGWETPVFRLKKRLMEALYLPEHPDIKYVIIT